MTQSSPKGCKHKPMDSPDGPLTISLKGGWGSPRSYDGDPDFVFNVCYKCRVLFMEADRQ